MDPHRYYRQNFSLDQIFMVNRFSSTDLVQPIKVKPLLLFCQIVSHNKASFVVGDAGIRLRRTPQNQKDFYFRLRRMFLSLTVLINLGAFLRTTFPRIYQII